MRDMRGNGQQQVCAGLDTLTWMVGLNGFIGITERLL